MGSHCAGQAAENYQFCMCSVATGQAIHDASQPRDFWLLVSGMLSMEHGCLRLAPVCRELSRLMSQEFLWRQLLEYEDICVVREPRGWRWSFIAAHHGWRAWRSTKGTRFTLKTLLELSDALAEANWMLCWGGTFLRASVSFLPEQMKTVQDAFRQRRLGLAPKAFQAAWSSTVCVGDPHVELIVGISEKGVITVEAASTFLCRNVWYTISVSIIAPEFGPPLRGQLRGTPMMRFRAGEDIDECNNVTLDAFGEWLSRIGTGSPTTLLLGMRGVNDLVDSDYEHHRMNSSVIE